MEKIIEKFELDIKSFKVKIIHDGKKALSDQDKGIKTLIELVGKQLKCGKNKGFIPYDNFECSIEWERIPTK